MLRPRLSRSFSGGYHLTQLSANLPSVSRPLLRIFIPPAPHFSRSTTQTMQRRWKSYDAFATIGRNCEPPQQAIWVNNVYSFGWYLHLARVVTRRIPILNWDPVLNSQGRAELSLMKHFEKGGHATAGIVSRLKEGGVLVHFGHQDEAKKALEFIRSSRPELEAYMVKGQPFLEDLLQLKPSCKLRVEFKKPESEEAVFDLFRPYGRINELTVDKTNATVRYITTREASNARICLHKAPIFGEGVIRITYTPYSYWTEYNIGSVLLSPRVIPFVAVGLSVTIVFLIEPVRLFSVARKLSLSGYGLRIERRGLRKNSADVWNVHNEVQTELQRSFERRPEMILLLSGPKGAGKSQLLQNCLKKRAFAVCVDAGAAQAQNVDFVDEFELAIGFFPSFKSIKKLVAQIDKLLMSKTQDTENTTTIHLERLLATVNKSLRLYSAAYPRDPLKPFTYPVIVIDGFDCLLQEMEGYDPSGETLLESRQQNAREIVLGLFRWAAEATSDGLAHVVFVTSSSLTQEQLRMKGEFGAMNELIRVVQMGDVSLEDAVEHLVQNLEVHRPAFHPAVGRPAGVGKAVGTASRHGNDNGNGEGTTDQPEPVTFWSILFGWRKRLQGKPALDDAVEAVPTEEGVVLTAEEREEARKAVKVTGGRLSSLTGLLRRVQAGTSMDDAVQDMLEEAKTYLSKRGFGDKLFVLESGHWWTQAQLWKAMKMIVREEGHVPHDRMLYEVFSGDDRALHGLIMHNILEFYWDHGGVAVQAGSPLFFAAISSLVNDFNFARRMEAVVVNELIKERKASLKSVEEELATLELAGKGGKAVQARMNLLQDKLSAADASLREAEAELKRLL